MNDVSTQGKRVYVLYHRNCMDGSAAKYAAYLVFGSRATYIAVQYNEKPPELDSGSDVYILDFSYSREVLEAWNARMNFLLVLDHHETAEKDLAGLPYARFNMKKSGAMLAWEYFHPGKTIPEVIHLVQDRDLWQFHWPQSREFHAGMQSRRENINDWYDVARSDDQGRYLRDAIKAEGKIILAYEAATMESIIVPQVRVVRFLHTTVGIVNSMTLRDETAQAFFDSQKDLAGGKVTGMIVYFFDEKANNFKLSFRGVPGTDWSWVAKRLGGGGHKRSCNAVVDRETLNQIMEGRFRHLPRKTWIGSIRNWLNTKLRGWEESMHAIN